MKAEYRLIPILRNVEPEHACAIVEVLLEAGVRCLEVSLSEEQKGLDCLAVLHHRFDRHQLLIGAGTVSTNAQVDKLKDLGIPFFVTPGFDGPLVDYALGRGIDVVPGVLTPSDVQQAQNRGLKLVKLFPAGAFPLHYVKDLKGPFPRMEFLAVGGVTPENIPDYLAAGFNGVGIGSSLVPQQAGPEQFASIRAAAGKCVRAVASCT